jgi:hypothetical protein
MESELKNGIEHERWVVLALAVWKAQCQDAMPSDVTFRTTVELRAWYHDWMTTGWKKHKQEHRGEREKSDVNLIVSLVRPFLRTPPHRFQLGLPESFRVSLRIPGQTEDWMKYMIL